MKFDGTVKLKLDPPQSAMDDPNAAMAFSMLNNLELTFRGTSQKDPMMAELFLTAAITGDAAMSITVSTLITEEKMWVKIPNTPFFPLPAELTDKYLELDFHELSEFAGEEIAFVDPEQQARYESLGKEMIEMFFDAFEEETFFTNVKQEDANLPSDVDAKQVIQLELTNDNLRTFIETVVKVLPALMEKAAEIEELGITQEEIDMMKADLEAGEEELQSSLDEFEELFSINELKMVAAIDSNGYVSYTGFTFDVDITDEGETGSIGFHVESKQSEINKNPKFEISEPDASDVVSLDELMSMFMMSPF